MKRILILAGFLSLFTQALTAIAQSDDQSWRDKVIVYYFNETLDGKMGSGPVLPVRYGQSNVFVATRHIAEMFAGERKGSVKAGYADGRMIPPTAWIPDPITGSCRDTHYSVDRYSVND